MHTQYLSADADQSQEHIKSADQNQPSHTEIHLPQFYLELTKLFTFSSSLRTQHNQMSAGGAVNAHGSHDFFFLKVLPPLRAAG